ncbi:MAG: hypothetical protein HY721_01435 [Planctomycetes bacterium]|nr:hypothetical protein [Planctomycetota bacterium]
MRPQKGRKVALTAAAIGSLVLGGAALASRDVLRDAWCVASELSSRDEQVRRKAIEWLGERGSTLAAPWLLEIGGRGTAAYGVLETSLTSEPPSEETLALEALSKIPLGDPWYLGRLGTGSLEARRGCIRRLGRSRCELAAPRLREIAAAEPALRNAAAVALAKVLAAVRPVISEEPPHLPTRHFRRFRLTNPTPCDLKYTSVAGTMPDCVLRQKDDGGWRRLFEDHRHAPGRHLEHVLAPGESVSFVVSVLRPNQAERPLQVGVPVAGVTLPGPPEAGILWSEELGPCP